MKILHRCLYLTALVVIGLSAVLVSGQHHDKSLDRVAGNSSDPLLSATVAFGGWRANSHPCPPAGGVPVACPDVDRFGPDPATQFPRFSNNHSMLPEVATIKAGGAVTFLIGGLHVISIYRDGTRPSDINLGSLVPGRPPMTPPIIDSPKNRIYRGLDPFLLPPNAQQDRIEVVQFDAPGLYLVICAVLPHFQEGMYGWVRVLPDGVSKKVK